MLTRAQPTLIGSTDKEGDFLVPFSIAKGINTTLSDLLTASAFTCPAYLESLFRAKSDVPVWRYRYMPRFPTVTPYKWMRGATHASDLLIVFGTTELLGSPTPAERAAEKYLQKIWVEFAKDPANGLAKLGWPKYSPKPKGMATSDVDGRAVLTVALEKTLVEIFPRNKIEVQFVDPQQYDKVCDNIQPIPWEEFAKGPPQ